MVEGFGDGSEADARDRGLNTAEVVSCLHGVFGVLGHG